MIDEFLVEGKSYQRLLTEYQKHGSLVIGFDFDGTVHDFHKKGHTYDQVIELLRNLNDINCRLICWTAYKDEEYVAAYLAEHDIPFHGINIDGVNLGYETRKPFFSALLDDRAGLIQVYNDLNKLYESVIADRFLQSTPQ